MYIDREREREKTYIYIYIYTHRGTQYSECFVFQYPIFRKFQYSNTRMFTQYSGDAQQTKGHNK